MNPRAHETIIYHDQVFREKKVMLQLNNTNEDGDNSWGTLLLDGYYSTSHLTTSPAVSA